MRGRRHRRAVWASLAAITAGFFPLATASAAPASTGSRPTPEVLSAPRLPVGAHVTREVPGATRLTASVYIEPRDPTALATFVAQVTGVGSPLHGHYLPRGAFAARFGPTPATIASVTRALRVAGLHVGRATSNGLRLPVAGDAAAFDVAFATRVLDVALPGGGRGRTTTALTLPAALAGRVAAVIGLTRLVAAHDGLVRPHARRGAHAAGASAALPRAGAGAPSACTAALATTQVGLGGITDDEVAHAYGADPLYAGGDLGKGQTVAVFELEPFAPSDVRAFERCYLGADDTSRITVLPVDGGTGTGFGSGEAALDVEDVVAMAPRANIRVYEAPNTSAGAVDEYNRIISDDTARIVTSSWGLCESDQVNYTPGAIAVESLLFEQAAAQGQTIFAASGDGGNDACAYHGNSPTQPVLSVEDPASQPYVVGVGGTTAQATTQPPVEAVWNDGGSNGASGGGVSSLWRQPPWMPATADAQSSGRACFPGPRSVCRTVPDVAAFADEYTGITTFYNGRWSTVGGTSSSAPLWAGLLAEVNASASCRAARPTTNGVGFVAPLLYDVAANPVTYASGFTDVTTGNNDNYGVTGTKYSARPGYDLATGLGSPELTAPTGTTGPGLAASLCAAAQGGGGVTVTAISPAAGSSLGGTHFTISGHGFRTAGVSDVRAVDVGTSPARSFRVLSDTRIVGVTSPASTPTSSRVLDRVTRHGGGALVSVTAVDGITATGPVFHYDLQARGGDVPTLVEVGPTGGTGRGGTRVYLYGTGFSGAKGVTFGGVPAKAFHVVSDTEIVAVSPGWRRSMCAADSVRGEAGVCQTEVRVRGAGGASPVVPTLPPYAGALAFNRLGMLVVPTGCGCEGYPTATEFDYTTRLTLTGVFPVDGPRFAGVPGGGALLELRGTGFNVLTLDWVDFGPPTVAASQDYSLLRLAPSGRVLILDSGVDPSPSPSGNTVPISVVTLAGNSNTRNFRYLPVQVVTSLSTDVLPSGGGTAFTIHGGGFRGTMQVEFQASLLPLPGALMQSGFRVRSARTITLRSPPLVPGSYAIWVCGPYSCGSGKFTGFASYTLDAIAPGATAVTSAEPITGGGSPTGNVAGGTMFEVQGTNFGPLSDLQVVTQNVLGTTSFASTGIVEGPAPTDPGATETVLVPAPVAPGGMSGYDNVLLSGLNGTSSLTPSATFTYLTS